jgi:hypothetical protein
MKRLSYVESRSCALRHYRGAKVCTRSRCGDHQARNAGALLADLVKERGDVRKDTKQKDAFHQHAAEAKLGGRRPWLQPPTFSARSTSVVLSTSTARWFLRWWMSRCLAELSAGAPRPTLSNRFAFALGYRKHETIRRRLCRIPQQKRQQIPQSSGQFAVGGITQQ